MHMGLVEVARPVLVEPHLLKEHLEAVEVERQVVAQPAQALPMIRLISASSGPR